MSTLAVPQNIQHKTTIHAHYQKKFYSRTELHILITSISNNQLNYENDYYNIGSVLSVHKPCHDYVTIQTMIHVPTSH